MSGDGAHQGVGAQRAIDTILGGKPGPQDTKEKTMTPEAMREKLEKAVEMGLPEGSYDDWEEEQRSYSYDMAASIAGGRVLAWLDEHPKFKHVPAEPISDWEDREKYEGYYIKYPGLGELMELTGVDIDEGLGLSGFQYGWAVNAAKYALGAPPSRNPALMTIGGDHGDS
jgi:hypothetical protein